MFAGKVKILPKVGASFKCSTWVGSSLSYKHKARLERFARDKHSSLLRKLVNYGHKKFYNIWPRSTVESFSSKILCCWNPSSVASEWIRRITAKSIRSEWC